MINLYLNLNKRNKIIGKNIQFKYHYHTFSKLDNPKNKTMTGTEREIIDVMIS